MRSPKLVLAGDHCQLPPTIVSAQAAAKGLDLTLMERVIGLCVCVYVCVVIIIIFYFILFYFILFIYFFFSLYVL